VQEGAAPSRADEVRVIELSKDQTPFRKDERQRIHAVGGSVRRTGGRWRVDGELLVSRCVCVCLDSNPGAPSVTQVERPWHESAYFLLSGKPASERRGGLKPYVSLMGATKAPDRRYGLVQAASDRHDSCPQAWIK
jgi:hypothetical protein